MPFLTSETVENAQTCPYYLPGSQAGSVQCVAFFLTPPPPQPPQPPQAPQGTRKAIANLIPRANVPFDQHQDTELWNSQQAIQQARSPRALVSFAFKISYCCSFKAKFRLS